MATTRRSGSPPGDVRMAGLGRVEIKFGRGVDSLCHQRFNARLHVGRLSFVNQSTVRSLGAMSGVSVRWCPRHALTRRTCARSSRTATSARTITCYRHRKCTMVQPSLPGKVIAAEHPVALLQAMAVDAHAAMRAEGRERNLAENPAWRVTAQPSIAGQPRP